MLRHQPSCTRTYQPIPLPMHFRFVAAFDRRQRDAIEIWLTGTETFTQAGKPATVDQDQSLVLAQPAQIDGALVAQDIAGLASRGGISIGAKPLEQKIVEIDRPGPLDGCPIEHHVRLRVVDTRSEEHTSELQSLMRISYAVFCLKKKKKKKTYNKNKTQKNKK